ncbi:MAG: hypothetical protein IJG41_06490 [Bacteroidales bacterium]|nr:hypothetical protein [Bacteroidales bacterium]
MKTKKMNLKAIVLSLGLVAMMLPANAMVQETAKRPGGLFGFSDQFVGEGLFQIRGEEMGMNLNVEIQPFQDPAPLGSGIAILIGAGLGYVALKKKEDEQ